MAIYYLCYAWINNQQLIPGTALKFTRSSNNNRIQMIIDRPAAFITVNKYRRQFKETGMIHSAITSIRNENML